MKKYFCLIFVLFSVFFIGCGKISPLDFYEACLIGDEKVVCDFISSEEFTVKLDQKSSGKFLLKLEEYDTANLFEYEYEEVFLNNPIAVSILGNNEAITKLLCDKLEDFDEENILYVAAKTNNIIIGEYLDKIGLLSDTYRPYVEMIRNDNIEFFNLFSDSIRDITVPVNGYKDNFLMIAVKEDAFNCVKYFVDSGLFDINAMNDSKQTALGYAYSENASEEVKDYIKKAKGEYLTSNAINLLNFLNDWAHAFNKHCDKGLYSHEDVMDLVYKVGSDSFSRECDELTLKARNCSDWEKNYITKAFNQFTEAFYKLQRERYFE